MIMLRRSLKTAAAVALHLLALHSTESTAFAPDPQITPKPCSAHPNTLQILHAIQPSLLDSVPNDSIQSLPIHTLLNDIRESLRRKPNLLLEAAPGAGKTTVVPLLLSDPRGKTLVVQPRRVAARSAARRMSSLLNERVGRSVGYSVRGEGRSSPSTSVLVVTDGVLLNMLRRDPELNGVNVVILDEFHERGVGSDACLALLREVQINLRGGLKIVVMSATLLGGAEEKMGGKLKRVLGEECNVIKSEGRQFPIAVKHSSGRTPLKILARDTELLVKNTADAVEEGILRAPGKKDVLAFLPGAKEVRMTVRELRDREVDAEIYPLYGALPKQEQDRALFERSRRRRVIVSSPIAEASLTIEGVTCVIDSGLQRQPKYDANTGLPHLVTVLCSRDSAVQRAGRAGRTQDGYCIRLFSENEFDNLPIHATPEICSTDLVPTTLLLSEWGCTSAREIIEDMPFVDPPPEESLDKAYRMLVDLEALEEYKLPNDNIKRYKVTAHGKELVSLTTHPRFATAIIKASQVGELHLAAAVTAAALTEDLINGGKETNLALNVRDVLREGQHTVNGKQLLNFATRISIEAKSAVFNAMESPERAAQVSECVGAALLPGFVDLIAQRKGDASYGSSTYMLALGQSARLDGKPDEGAYVIVVDTSTGDDGKTRIRSYSKIDALILREVASVKEEVYIKASKGYEIRKRKVITVGSLVLSSTPMPSPSSEEVTNLYLDTIDELGGVSVLLSMQSKRDAAVLQELLQRMSMARRSSSDNDWPSCFASLDAIRSGIGTEDDQRIVLGVIEPWLGAAESLKGLDLLSILNSELSPEQQTQLDNFFPTKIIAPDGSEIPITYNSETGPIATAKLQQFFGQQESPTVGPPGRTTPVTLSLLSPSGKPLAQTIDLPFFWRETYPAVRAEMRGRYPKHPWPENPFTAVATKLTKKQEMKTAGEVATVDKRKERSKQRKKR